MHAYREQKPKPEFWEYPASPKASQEAGNEKYLLSAQCCTLWRSVTHKISIPSHFPQAGQDFQALQGVPTPTSHFTVWLCESRPHEVLSNSHLQAAHILQLLISQTLAFHRNAFFHLFYVYITWRAVWGLHLNIISLPHTNNQFPCTNQIFMLAFKGCRLHPAVLAAGNLLTSQARYRAGRNKEDVFQRGKGA